VYAALAALALAALDLIARTRRLLRSTLRSA